MEEYDNLISTLNEILNTADSIQDITEKNRFLESNLRVFNEFKDSINVILKQYQFKEKDNVEQNEKSDIVKNIIIRLLDQKDLQFEYYKSSILDALSYNENKYAFNLQHDKDMKHVQCALEYLQDRSEYVAVLENNDFFAGQEMNKSAAKKYVSDNYEQNVLGHALIQIKNNFLNLPREEITNIVQYIDKSAFFTNLISKNTKDMNFYEKNLMYQYSETILKMKSIFVPEKLKEDQVISAMWNGKIQDKQMLENILETLSVKSFIDMLGYEKETSENGFFQELSIHFKNVNLSDKNISLIMRSILDKKTMIYEAAKVLSAIDMPEDKFEFLDSYYLEEFIWLIYSNAFESLKNCEKDIEDATKPFLPAEYYIKKINRINEMFSSEYYLENQDGINTISNVNPHFIGNLITLIHTDYYTEEEKEQLKECLKKCKEFNEYNTSEEIIFDEEDSPDIINLKVKKAYYSGQIIPTNISQMILNDNITNNTPMKKSVLQACVQSIICNTLQSKGIDIQNKVFFGEGYGLEAGYCDPNNKCIWIDDTLLEIYRNNSNLPEKVYLFKAMFHEMRHVIQYYNIEKGKIDYLTYNFIKEEVIEEYDKNYYSENYKSIFMESDARKEEILGALEFMNGLNPDFVEAVQSEFENDYISESENHTLYSDSKKQISIGKDTEIDVSDYVGYLIQNNPKILTENPILAIEYNQDGTKKTLETVLQEYEDEKIRTSCRA